MWLEEVDALAREIAGKDVSAEIQASARLVAEAQIDLRRVCEARQLLLMSLTTSKPFEAKYDLKRRFLSNILGVGMVRTSTTARLSSLTPVDEGDARANPRGVRTSITGSGSIRT